MKKRRHIIISGTGRTGTSFLIELLTDLGLDTGFGRNKVSRKISKNARAGLEKNILKIKAPYIVKSPSLCNNIGRVMKRSNIIIEHAFVPIRDLAAVAESRIRIFRMRGLGVKGGLWDTENPDEQAIVLAVNLHKLLVELAKKQIPMTFIHYPKLTKNPKYLFEKLQPILKNMDFAQFQESFNRKVRPKWVHKYNERDI